MQRKVQVALVLLIAIFSVVGCVTRRFVREQLDKSNARIEHQLVEMKQPLVEVKQRLEKLESDKGEEKAQLTTQVAEIRTVADEALKRAEQASAMADAAMIKAEEASRATGQTVGNGSRKKRELFETASETLVVVFGFDSWELDERARTTLMKTAQQLKDNPSLMVKLEGHSDSLGLRSYNVQLSQRRADVVRRFLVDRGIAFNRIQSVGVGEIRPVADNRSRSGRDQNRRVTITLFVPAG